MGFSFFFFFFLFSKSIWERLSRLYRIRINSSSAWKSVQGRCYLRVVTRSTTVFACYRQRVTWLLFIYFLPHYKVLITHPSFAYPTTVMFTVLSWSDINGHGSSIGVGNRETSVLRNCINHRRWQKILCILPFTAFFIISFLARIKPNFIYRQRIGWFIFLELYYTIRM